MVEASDSPYVPNVIRDDRNTAHTKRCAVIRERVLDHLMERGGRVSRLRMTEAKYDFAKMAVRLGVESGVRVWKESGGKEQIEVAKQSLDTLLGDKVVINPGKNGQPAKRVTGVNVGWVLDLWEAVLDHYHRQSVYVRPALTVVPEPEDGAGDDGDGPQWVAEPPAERALSDRVLDAYLNRDDEAMMRLAVEIERLERA